MAERMIEILNQEVLSREDTLELLYLSQAIELRRVAPATKSAKLPLHPPIPTLERVYNPDAYKGIFD